MTGRRIYSDGQGGFFADAALTRAVGTFADVREGDYWFWCGGLAAKCPGGLHANLVRHRVEEHEDGTVTVRPSILVTYDGVDGHKEYHGWLERGVWRTA